MINNIKLGQSLTSQYLQPSAPVAFLGLHLAATSARPSHVRGGGVGMGGRARNGARNRWSSAASYGGGLLRGPQAKPVLLEVL